MAYKINALEIDGEFEYSDSSAKKTVKRYKLALNRQCEVWYRGKGCLSRTKCVIETDVLPNGIKYNKTQYKNVEYIDDTNLQHFSVVDVVYPHDKYQII